MIGKKGQLTGDGGTGERPTARASAYGPLKAAVDWVAALLLLLGLAPFLACVAVAVALTSPGPIIYSQTRLGKAGSHFRIWKFRTMVHGCESGTGPVWSIANDPRTTCIGRFLRRTHIDELPQLWNVLRGEMSLIGPRPERPEIAAKIEQVLPEFRDRLEVRPGLSGLAQVLIPPDADIHTVRRKLTHDVEYIRCFGLVLDVRIALATVLCLAGFPPVIAGWLVRDAARVTTPKSSPVQELPPMTISAFSAGHVAPITIQESMAA